MKKLKTPVQDVDYYFRFHNKKKNETNTYNFRFDGPEGDEYRFLNVETGSFFHVTKDRASYMLAHNLIKTVPIDAKKTEPSVHKVQIQSEPGKECSDEEFRRFLDDIIAQLDNISDEKKDLILFKYKIDVKDLSNQFIKEKNKSNEQYDSVFFGKLMSQFMLASTV